MIPDPTIRACLTADEAFAELGIDRTTGYRSIKEGTFPVPVIRVGRLIRIPTAALRQLLDPTAEDSRTDDTYPDDSTGDSAGQSPPLTLVPRPELAHQRTQAVTRPARNGGRP